MNIKELFKHEPNTDLKTFFKSGLFRNFLIIVGSIVVLLFVFEVGTMVGFKKASFAFNSGDNYYRAFGKQDRGFFGMPMMFNDGDDLAPSHNVVGQIVKIGLPNLYVEAQDGVEKVITIASSTLIKKFRGDISSAELQNGDLVVIFGEPNNKAQIEAKLIRVLPPPSTERSNNSMMGNPIK